MKLEGGRLRYELALSNGLALAVDASSRPWGAATANLHGGDGVSASGKIRSDFFFRTLQSSGTDSLRKRAAAVIRLGLRLLRG